MEMKIILINLLYVLIGIFAGFLSSRITFKIMDKLFPYDTVEELKKRNRAVGNVTSAVIMGNAIIIGLVIGLGLNRLWEIN